MFWMYSCLPVCDGHVYSVSVSKCSIIRSVYAKELGLCDSGCTPFTKCFNRLSLFIL